MTTTTVPSLWDGPTPLPNERVAPLPATQPPDLKRADVLDKLGSKLALQIQAMRAQPRQTNTHRRAHKAAGAMQHADHLEERVDALWALADACRRGTVPFALRGVRTLAVIDNLLDYKKWPDSKFSAAERARLLTASIDEAHYLAARDALLALLHARKEMLRGETDSELVARQKAIRAKEIELALAHIPDFFPTPRALAERMIAAANLPGIHGCVLEPSAGRGDICDAIRDMGFTDFALVCCEYNTALADLLRLKGYHVIKPDFLTHTLAELRAFDAFAHGYARIIMNPPMSGLVDIDHVLHAYDLLAPGGRVVALMSESPFYNGVKKATAFRAWLDAHDGTSESLGSAFAQADRKTGANVRLVVIDKPGSEVA